MFINRYPKIYTWCLCGLLALLSFSSMVEAGHSSRKKRENAASCALKRFNTIDTELRNRITDIGVDFHNVALAWVSPLPNAFTDAFASQLGDDILSFSTYVGSLIDDSCKGQLLNSALRQYYQFGLNFITIVPSAVSSNNFTLIDSVRQQWIQQALQLAFVFQSLVLKETDLNLIEKILVCYTNLSADSILELNSGNLAGASILYSESLQELRKIADLIARTVTKDCKTLK